MESTELVLLGLLGVALSKEGLRNFFVSITAASLVSALTEK